MTEVVKIVLTLHFINFEINWKQLNPANVLFQSEKKLFLKSNILCVILKRALKKSDVRREDDSFLIRSSEEQFEKQQKQAMNFSRLFLWGWLNSQTLHPSENFKSKQRLY